MSVGQVLTPITYNIKTQLFDPFYGSVKIGNIFANSAQWLTTSKKDYKKIKNILEGDAQSLKALERRRTFYKNASDLEAMRRRAYEFAYIEFKKQVVETGPNSGPSITTGRFGLDSYQSKGGFPNGGELAAWCSCFTGWCYDNAGFNIPSGVEIGRVPAWRARGFKKMEGSNLFKLEPGDLVIYGENAHVGLFSKWLIPPNNGRGVFSSIEGNTQLDIVFRISKDSNGYYTRTELPEQTINNIFKARREKGLFGTKDSKWVAGRRRIYPTEFIVETRGSASVEFYRINRGNW
jgi:hypothetical protein